MYTIVPFHTRREMSNPFDDRFFRSFFDMNDMVGSAGFRVDVKEQQDSYLLEAELPDAPCVLTLSTRLMAGDAVLEQSALPVYVGERGPLEAAFRRS